MDDDAYYVENDTDVVAKNGTLKVSVENVQQAERLCKQLNYYEENRLKRRKEIEELRQDRIDLLDVVDGFLAFRKLQKKGWYD